MFHSADHYGVNFTVGQAGVDVFFVISGLIMWTITEKPAAPSGFLFDRVIRIVPMYWLATMVFVVGGLFHVFSHLILTVPYVIASLFFVPWPSPEYGMIWPVLVPGWTLNYEMVFYLLIALAQLLPRRLQLPALLAVLASAVGLGVWLQPTQYVAKFYTQPIILEFGVGLAFGALRGAGRLPGRVVSALLIVLGIAAYAGQTILHLNGERLFYYGLPAAVLVLGVIGLERSGVPFRFEPLKYAGDGSYSIYLFHTFALILILKLLPSHIGAWAMLPVAAAAAGVSLGAYQWIERPLVNRLRSLRKPQAKTAPQAAEAGAV